jgi:hypothetical protein
MLRCTGAAPGASSPSLTNLDDARREREDSGRRKAREAARPVAELGSPYVAAADVVTILNRVGECVRALPSFGRTRTQTSAVLAKRTLSAISTCKPTGLSDGDALRSVLARLDAARSALRETEPSGAQRIAAVRRLGQRATDDGAEHELGPPAHSYLICHGQVIRQPGDHGDGTADEVHPTREERIEDLVRAGALIAAEIDRLQHDEQRRYA